jgi:Ca2+-binding RTX toxin-like protein
VQSSITHTLGFGLENLVLTGSAAINGTGNGNHNVITGNSANNVLDGLAGNDTLTGGSGNDRLDGGSGIDTASYATATAGVTVDLYYFTEGQPQNTGGAGLDTLVGIENLTGSNFNDTLLADFPAAEQGTLNGGTGNDRLVASHSEYTLNGDAGDDELLYGNGDGTLNGGTGNDHLQAGDGGTLNGGDGNDVLEAGELFSSILNGGAGADTLYCGVGGSICDYNAVSDSPAGAGRDVIYNFGPDPAKIDLTDIDANSLVAGNQAFTWIGSSAFTAAGQLRYNTTTGLLQGSTDGDTAAEFEIQLVGAPALVVGGTGTDILL